MSQEKIYPKGLRVFKPNDNAPDFVKGTLIITPNELFTFCKENESLMSEYNGSKQLKCQILDGNNGLYFQVDTYKPAQQSALAQAPPAENAPAGTNRDLPF